MKRVYNFSAGPSTLPESVLLKIQEEALDKNNTGMSVMEMSHRSSEFMAILEKAKQNLIELMSIPSNYEVLFLQGGASLQFAMIPMNLLKKTKKLDFVQTGVWSEKAMVEASLFGEVSLIASGESDHYKKLPSVNQQDVHQDADYLHYVSNNTIHCTQFQTIPYEHHTLVCDMSSDICSKPVDVSKYGLIFAGAQKNLGIAGVTIVIIRKDLLQTESLNLPSQMDYSVYAKKGSMANTPPTFSIYACGLVMEWIKELGGLSAMKIRNQFKANLLYEAIDQSTLFVNDRQPSDRSLMNVMFTTNNDELDTKFINYAATQECVGIKGHRSTKGCRASIYNAMSMDGVRALVDCMHTFEEEFLKENPNA